MLTIETILKYVTEQEDKYYDLAAKASQKGDILDSTAHLGEATAFQRVRYLIEENTERDNSNA